MDNLCYLAYNILDIYKRTLTVGDCGVFLGKDYFDVHSELKKDLTNVDPAILP